MSDTSNASETTAFSATDRRTFLLSKLSEMAARSDQISNAMQIALGFMITLTAALLAILVSIGQTINENSAAAIQHADSFSDFLQALFLHKNIILWAAGAVFALIGSSSNLTALAIHNNSKTHYKELADNYNTTITRLVGADDFSNDEQYLASLPSIDQRIKRGCVEGIYLKTAYAFQFLFTIFGACFFESIATHIMSSITNCPSPISVNAVVTIPLISLIIGIGSFCLLYKKVDNKKSPA